MSATTTPLTQAASSPSNQGREEFVATFPTTRPPSSTMTTGSPPNNAAIWEGGTESYNPNTDPWDDTAWGANPNNTAAASTDPSRSASLEKPHSKPKLRLSRRRPSATQTHCQSRTDNKQRPASHRRPLTRKTTCPWALAPPEDDPGSPHPSNLTQDGDQPTPARQRDHNLERYIYNHTHTPSTAATSNQDQPRWRASQKAPLSSSLITTTVRGTPRAPSGAHEECPQP